MDLAGEGEVLMGGPSSVTRGIPLHFRTKTGIEMGIQLLTDEIENLAREISDATGESLIEVYRQALLERKERLSGANLTPQEREARRKAFFAKLDARPRTQDTRSWREIEQEELYDEFGQPFG